MSESKTIKVSELKKYLQFGEKELSADTEKGTICCVWYNRAPPTKLFVVLENNENKFSCVAPRLLFRDNKIAFGQDTQTETQKWSYTCECYPGQGYSGCDCDNDAVMEYRRTFEEVSDDYEYNIYDFVPLGEYFVSYSEVSKDRLNDVDRPRDLAVVFTDE